MNSLHLRTGDLPRSLSRGAVAGYMEANGFLPDKIGGVYFSNSDGIGFVLPPSQEDRSYDHRVMGILEYFAEEHGSLADVVDDVLNPDTDLLEYKLIGGEADAGAISIVDAAKFCDGIYRSLRFCAAGAISARRNYRRTPDLASSFASSCRFSQTRLGSFVMRIRCPIFNYSAPGQIHLGTLGRSTLSSYLDNVHYLAGEDSLDQDEPLPPALNDSFAAAIRDLRPRSVITEALVAVKYKKSRPSSAPPSVLLDYDQEGRHYDAEFGPFIYDRAETVRQRLAPKPRSEPTKFRGYIIGLAKDPPVFAEQSRKIVVYGKFKQRHRSVTIRLISDVYSMAVRWHELDMEVEIEANVEKAPSGRYYVSRLFSIRPLDDSAQLFEHMGLQQT